MADDTDNYVDVPAQFWAEILQKGVEIIGTRATSDGGEIKAYANGWKVYENWVLGNFATRSPEGAVTEVRGMQIYVEELERMLKELRQ